MKTGTIAEIKKELQELEPRQLVDLCIELARYKKDNKEFLGYLIFEAHDKATFMSEVKLQVDQQFAGIDRGNNLYYTKKSLRKILRQIVKYCRYLNDKGLAADLHLYFCYKLKESGIPFRKSQLLINLFEQELKKIKTLIAALHPDLQSDYTGELNQLINE
ncbi:MAG: hypothetical protein IT236_07700 [Bacteroidia bacterium]|nr:hypothetical protein [Bacteroidia bacterium]